MKANVLFFDRMGASEKPWTKTVWFYDLREEQGTLPEANRITRADQPSSSRCYNPKNRHDRKPASSEKNPGGRWRSFSYENLVVRDKVSLDSFWIRGESLKNDNLLAPHVPAKKIV